MLVLAASYSSFVTTSVYQLQDACVPWGLSIVYLSSVLLRTRGVRAESVESKALVIPRRTYTADVSTATTPCLTVKLKGSGIA